MIDADEAPAQKRKASPSPLAEDAPPKRMKVEKAGSEATGDNAPNGNGHAHEETNGASSNVKTENPSNGNGSAPKHGRPEEQAPAPEEQPFSRRRDSEAAARPPSESRKSFDAPPSRRDIAQDEKKRGKRLFGGLMKTLSQTTSSSQHKKQLELERRRQERASQQRAADDKRRAEKLAKLNHARKIEQVRLDEQIMHARHSDMLVKARSLSTNCEPRLYYRPWKLTRDQEDIIDGQIREAKEIIARETQEFEIRKEERLRELGVPRSDPQPETTSGEPKPPDHTNLDDSAPSEGKGAERDHYDKDEEMVQVDEEDTVLY